MKKIAIPTCDGRVDDHFGHCDHYTVFTLADDGSLVSKERLESPQGCGCKSNIAQTMQQMGITLMLAGNMGMGAFNKLTQHGIDVVRGCAGTIEDVLAAYVAGSLTDSAEACDHHDCPSHDHAPAAGGFKLDI